jgi:protoporphyrinogen oxidase
VLSAFLGAAALGSCRRASPALPDVGGELLDDSHLLGHLLREAPPPRATGDTRALDVLVIGAGAAGLSAAWRLRGAGLDDLLVVEVAGQAGGTARAGRNGFTAFPWGAHYLPAPQRDIGPTSRLLHELGVITGTDDDGAPRYAEQVLVHEPDERLFYQGQWYEGLYLRAGASDDDLAQLRRFEALMRAFASAHDGRGRKAFAVPLSRGSDDAEWTQLDRLTMAEWLEGQRFSSQRLRWMVEYACRDDYGTTLTSTSAWAALWYFCARQSGGERAEGYLSWPEGNGHLVAHLLAQVGTQRLRTGALIHTVERDGAGWLAHGLDAQTRAPLRYRARQVVLAVPRFVASRLVADLPPVPAQTFTSSPWVVANLTLSARPKARGFPLSWDNVLYDSQSLGYVVATHQRERAEETGPTVLTWYYPLTGADPKAERTKLLGTSWADWKAIVLADLLPAHLDLHRRVERIDVLRWGHAMVRPVPGFIWGAARARAALPVARSLHFAHTELSGIALFEEANWHGVRAAEAVLAELGVVSASWR